MKVSDIRYGQINTLSIQPELDDDFGTHIPKIHEVSLILSGASPALLEHNEQAWTVKGAGNPKQRDGKRNQIILEKLLADNLPRLCWVVHSATQDKKTATLTLQVHSFPDKFSWPEAVDFVVDDKIIEDLRKKRRSLESVEKAIEWLSSKFLLPFPGTARKQTRLFLSGPPRTAAAQQNKFRLYGQGYAADIAKQPDNKLRVERVVEVKHTPTQAIWLAEGQFKFCNMTAAGKMRGMAETALDQIVRKANSYLNIWQEYNKLERHGIIRRTGKFGWLEYKKAEARPYGNRRFHLTQDSDLSGVIQRLKEGEEIDLEAAAQLPPELQDSEFKADDKKFRRPEFVGICVDYSQKNHTVDLRPHFSEDNKPPPRGVIFISFSGDEKRLERRNKARDLIVSARCPMPQLGLLLEDKPLPLTRHKAEQALSAGVCAHIGGQPTERQAEALKIALNTPDIALIQGPPGTGKTRVIAALQARLAELGETSEGIGGQTLLTSYQHDAVENAAERSSVFGLPAIKIGKRWGDKEESDSFERWRQERISAVRAKLAKFPKTPVSQALREVRKQHLAYVGAPLPAQNMLQLLKDAADWAGAWLPGELFDRLTAMQQALQFGSRPSADNGDLELVRKAVRGLRTEAVAFGDDGPRNAYKALKRLQDAQIDLEDSNVKLLQRAADWKSPDSPPFLADLTVLKERLLDRLTATETPADKPRANMEIAALLGETVDVLYEKSRKVKGSEAAVLEEYRHDLKHDPERVRETVRHYTAVLAATCQQAVGYQMSLAKNEDTVFNSVIVDEAARANPLDLFIPMSRAERRIVLVGDHRQLPHILEPDVERELESSIQDETREALKKSLFERLFNQLREREKKDGIRRVITLDTQYRMHPLLGEFVSHAFYAAHGEGFRSGRPAEDFSHDLSSFEGKVAAWIDIPFKHGAEKSGKSKSRAAEARWIADNLKKLMGRNLSVGVIAFYAAQVDMIFRELEKTGFTTQTEAGAYRIADAWQQTEDSTGHIKERLRIGTVDAFQGKEFDVVILSMTRSNNFPHKDTDPAVQNKLWRRKYGHLMLENRLCVAMSRQQRLLITAGDSDMLRNPGSGQAIPALLKFYQFCEGEHGCIHSI
ncbi:MAG: AAA family ATPase [Gammaproteobacteria bacterium]|nr:AAA family ATPase [Gammaproteobacteria bacterium]